MRVVPAVAAIVLATSLASAQAPITPGVAPPQVVPPAAETPAQGQPPVTDPLAAQGAVPPPAAAPVTPPLTRSFTTKAGLLFNTVRPERVADFETVLWYLDQALKSSTDPAVRAQAQGWKVMKATEPGPNASVLYVFVLDPAVPRADYGLGRILADAYPEQVQEIWRMYQGAVTSGGSLLNLTPVEPKPPAPVTAAPTGAQPSAPARTPPPNVP